MPNYQVKKGDSLSAIAQRLNIPWQQLQGYRSGNPNRIYPGEMLSYRGAQPMMPTPQVAPQPAPRPQYQPMGSLGDRPVSSPMFVKGTPDWVKPLIERASSKFEIPAIVLSALLKQESGFNPQAVSPVGAMGIAQFMPDTARGYGIDPWDPAQAIQAAAKYLRNGLNQFGKIDLALAAYNAGAGAVKRYGGVPPYKETQNYVKRIMAMAGEPHQSAYGPVTDQVFEAKKQSEKMSKPNFTGAQASKPRQGGFTGQASLDTGTPINYQTAGLDYNIPTPEITRNVSAVANNLNEEKQFLGNIYKGVASFVPKILSGVKIPGF